MSTFIIIYDTETKELNVEGFDILAPAIDMYWGFESSGSAPIDGEPIKFSNLSFGYTLRDINGVIMGSKSWPEEGAWFEEIDQPYLLAERVYIKTGETYNLSIFCKNDGYRTDTTIEFTSPVPDSPYPSWIWDSESDGWHPPIPSPYDLNDGREAWWEWNEDEQSWEYMTDELYEQILLNYQSSGPFPTKVWNPTIEQWISGSIISGSVYVNGTMVEDNEGNTVVSASFWESGSIE